METKITRWHDDPNKSKDWGSSLVYNEFMNAWITYELVQVLHIYRLTPAVRSNLQDVSSDLFKIETFMRDRTTQNAKDYEDAEKLIQQLFAGTDHSAIFKQMGFGNMTHFKQLTCYAIISHHHIFASTSRVFLSSRGQRFLQRGYARCHSK